jgi:hypothetical protein
VEYPQPEEGLVASVGEVASRLRLGAGLTDEQTQIILDALQDAQAYLEGELNRPLVPQLVTVQGAELQGGWLDMDKASSYYGLTSRFDDKITILAKRANANGTFDLDLRVGLDGPNTPAIRRFVVLSAVKTIDEDPSTGMARPRQVTSLSAEGQSINYGSAAAAADIGGQVPPAVSTLKQRHLKRGVFIRTETAGDAKWPYNGRSWGSR